MEHTQIGELIGGAFGVGANRIKRRAFRDLVRYYNKGDCVSFFGFSRGAAIARMLAFEVAHLGVPSTSLAYTLLKLSYIGRPLRRLLVRVAAFGVPKNVFGIPFGEVNLFRNFTVASSVKHGIHMVSIDEARDAFLPTLMDPDRESKKYGSLASTPTAAADMLTLVCPIPR